MNTLIAKLVFALLITCKIFAVPVLKKKILEFCTTEKGFTMHNGVCMTICQKRRIVWARFTGDKPVHLVDSEGVLVAHDIGRWVPQCDEMSGGHFKS